MSITANPGDSMDPFNLNRFLQAQDDDYQKVLSEIKGGQKQSHWMWYIFPQFHGLGSSAISRHYSIKTVGEAKAFLNHPVLGKRLIACAEAVLAVEHRSAHDIFGTPDDMKLKSCATLFAYVSKTGSVFEQLLDRYYQGERDSRTLELLENHD